MKWLRARRARRACRRRQRQCFHHASRYSGDVTQLTATEASWVEAVAHVDGGRRMFLCLERKGGCGKTWFI